MRIYIFIFFILASSLFSQEIICIGGKNCNCNCTKNKNKFYEEFKKQGVVFPKLICGCSKSDMDKCLENKIPEITFKKQTNCIIVLP